MSVIWNTPGDNPGWCFCVRGSETLGAVMGPGPTNIGNNKLGLTPDGKFAAAVAVSGYEDRMFLDGYFDSIKEAMAAVEANTGRTLAELEGEQR